MMDNIWKELELRFTKFSDRTAVNDQNDNLISYADLYRNAKNVAAQIRSVTDAGSRICILNSNSYFDAVAVLGILAADCTVVPMSLNYGEKNCTQIVKRGEPALLISDINPLPEPIAEAVREQNVTVVSADTSFGDWEEQTLRGADDVAMIMFTSGTTGIPKGAMLSHGNILSNLSDIAAYFTMTEEDHFLIARPLYHGAVMTGEFLHGLMHGSRITFYSEAFSPRRLVAFLAEHQCTTMCATPTLFYHLSMNKRKVELPDLKKVVVSGECLNPQVAEKIHSVSPDVSFFNVYGLTEASPRVSHLDPEFFAGKVGSVGVPLNSVSAKVLNDEGVETVPGEKGELLIKGPNVMKGYWKDEDLTSQKIVDEWLHTGDMCHRDEDGFIYISGRKDHMIIRAGVNIYPQDIENILLKNDAFREVLVWGEEDTNYGQRICAAVVPESETEMKPAEVISICKELLESYRWPDEVLIVESLLRNGSGKVMRQRPVAVKG